MVTRSRFDRCIATQGVSRGTNEPLREARDDFSLWDVSKQRVVAAFLWFYAGWYIGAAIAYFLGLPDAFGVIMGTGAAALMAGDPRRLIWRIRTSSASSGPARA